METWTDTACQRYLWVESSLHDIAASLTLLAPQWPYTGRKYTTGYPMNGPQAHMDEELMGGPGPGPGPMPGMPPQFPPYYRYVSPASLLSRGVPSTDFLSSRACHLHPVWSLVVLCFHLVMGSHHYRVKVSPCTWVVHLSLTVVSLVTHQPV